MKSMLPFVIVLALAPGAFPQNAERNPDRYRQTFELPGIEFSDAQNEKVAEIRKKYLPKLEKNQSDFQGLYTREQRQARREAMQKARAEGKSGRSAREIVDAAVKLSEEQQTRLETIQKERGDLQTAIAAELKAILTEEQQQQIRQRANRNRNANRNSNRGARPTHANFQYGPHQRQVMDVWLAESDKPTPVLVSIHGGGFRGGNKSVDRALLQKCLDSGVSVAAITYRLSDVAIAPAQFHDAARAVQTLRHRAKEWNLDPQRFAGTGGSAGAGLSLWLGFHDDLADADNPDPVLRESSRLQAMAVYNGQTSYDPRVIRDLFPGTDTYKHPALSQLYDVNLDELDDLPQEKYRLFEEVSAMPHLTKDDAPVLLMYGSQFDTPIRNQGVGIHHPKFGKVLQDKMKDLGIACKVKTGIRRGNEEFVNLTFEFVKKHLLTRAAKN